MNTRRWKMNHFKRDRIKSMLIAWLVCVGMLLSGLSPVQAAPDQVQKNQMDERLYSVLLAQYNQMEDPDIGYGNPIPADAFDQVEQLVLVNRGITSLLGFDLFSFNHLRELNLTGNRLENLNGFPGSLPELESLSVANNSLTTLAGLPNSFNSLRELNLSGNQLASLGLMPQSLPQLSILDLSENELSGAHAFDGLPVLPGLAELSLADNGLTSLAVMPPALKIPALEVLEVDSNQLTTLTGMPDYTAIPLAICNLANNQITSLAGFDQLRDANNNGGDLTFNIAGNSIDLSSIQNLAQILPGVVFLVTAEDGTTEIWEVVASSTLLTVSNPATTGFNVTLSPSLDGLTASNFTLLDSSSNLVLITGVQTSDNGATYAISAALGAGKTYTITAVKSGYDFGKAQNVVVPTAPVPVTYTLTVNNGKGAGDYNAGATATVKATVPEGNTFGGWQAEDGNILTYNQTYSFIITRNMTLTAILSDIPLIPLPTVTLDNSVSYDTTNSAFVIMKILGTFTAPTGYQMIDYGFVSVKNAATDPSTSLTLQTTGATIVKVTTNQAGQAYRQIKTTYGATFYVRGYMTYKNTSGDTVTIYSTSVVTGVKSNQ